MRILNVVLWAWACITFWVGIHCASLHFIFFISLLSLISWSCFWHYGCFSFRLWIHSPWCVHIHATDQSVAMHILSHNTDCAYSSFAIVFSASFRAIGIDWATAGTLQQVQVEVEVTVDWQHASRCGKRCGKRETRRSEKVAHIIGLQMRPL